MQRKNWSRERQQLGGERRGWFRSVRSVLGCTAPRACSWGVPDRPARRSPPRGLPQRRQELQLSAPVCLSSMHVATADPSPIKII